MSSNGPPRNYCGILKTSLKTCAKWTKMRVYTRYDQDIIDIQILTQESIWDNPENVKSIEKNLNNIPKRDIDPNKDEIVPLEDTFKETRNKHRSRVPKNHPISNVMSNVNKHVVTKR